MKPLSLSDIKKLYESGRVRESDRKVVEEVLGVKKSKYRNTKTEYEGIKFDSEKECRRYKELRILMKVGEIGMLELQVEYKFEIKGEKIGSYFADFRYLTKSGELVVEDVKSEITRKLPVYRLKRRMMKAQYGITIKET